MQNRYKHLLVPLDGSELAEQALIDALAMAKLIDAEVTLLRVVLPIKDVIAEYTHHAIHIDEQWETRKKLAHDYLEGICERWDCGSLTIHITVKKGSVAETIIDYTRDHPIDLIVMATHGRSGLQRWVYGSVADKVLRGADLHVWLVRARE